MEVAVFTPKTVHYSDSTISKVAALFGTLVASVASVRDRGVVLHYSDGYSPWACGDIDRGFFDMLMVHDRWEIDRSVFCDVCVYSDQIFRRKVLTVPRFAAVQAVFVSTNITSAG